MKTLKIPKLFKFTVFRAAVVTVCTIRANSDTTKSATRARLKSHREAFASFLKELHFFVNLSVAMGISR